MIPDLPTGPTPIDPDEADGLLHPHAVTRRELNELEEMNIQAGAAWAVARAVLRRTRVDVLTEEFAFELHRRMFGEVWSWAGSIRRTDKNIGVDKHEIRVEIRNLIQDARLWRSESVYPIDELAVRVHHRLVWIHPFPNGNGRHARLIADLIVQQRGRDPFSWGGRTLTEATEVRRQYIDALRSADRGVLEPLLRFARS